MLNNYFIELLLLIDRFIENVPEQLELETGDALQSTPLLLACMGGSLDTVKMLVDSGAKISKLNMQRHGVVELSAFRVGFHCFM